MPSVRLGEWDVKRILFVDDELKVLEGLQRMLRPMRREWDMAFAQSGSEALDALAQRPFDVVVSDMRMPGMDGGALLTEVMRQYPQIVRIVLSGYSAGDMAIRSAATAHQYLPKPCDAEKLKKTIGRAFGLRDLLADESLKTLLSRLRSIPSIPTVYAALMEELRNPDSSTRQIGEIISQDAGMTAKVLQLVNSAFFGLPRHVSSPGQAAVLLGTDTLRTLVLSVEVFSQFKNIKIRDVDVDTINRHSTETGAMARRIAKAQGAGREVADASVMASILHDVGKLILAQNVPEQYQQAAAHARDKSAPLWKAEREVFGSTHAEVGAYLLGLWGLPDPIVEATAFHHCPGRSFGEKFAPLTAVHVANVLVHDWHDKDNRESEEVDFEYLAQLGLADRVPAWREACRTALNDGDDG